MAQGDGPPGSEGAHHGRATEASETGAGPWPLGEVTVGLPALATNLNLTPQLLESRKEYTAIVISLNSVGGPCS